MRLWLGTFLLLIGSHAFAGPDPRTRVAEQALAAESRTAVAVTWDGNAQHPRLVRGSFLLPTPDRESAVRLFLQRHAALFHLDLAGLTLTRTSEHDGLAGTYQRFAEHIDGLPVFAGEIVVLTKAERGATEIRTLNLAQVETRRPDSTAPSIDAAAALTAAQAAIGVGALAALDAEIVLGIDPAPPATLAYRVRFRNAQPAASWEALVDARDGHVRSFRDRIVHANGSGLVFDPNPVASTGNTSLLDNGNATSAALDAARYAVTLPRLDGSGFLRGSYVDATPKNAAQRALSAGLTFEFDRSNDHFEEVMAYYHIDRVQNRIQSVLGFAGVDNRAQVAVVDDGPQDNSYYDPATKEIHFGSGGVDDAEDAEVIVHEYGHSIQDDQVPGFGNGDEGAMGEGFGDYLAGSASAVLSHQITDPYCIADWDSTSYSPDTPPCLRRLDGSKHWPEFADGEVHDDGEMWSAALFKSWQALGADTMDRLVIESHFLLSNDEVFQSAVDAILATDVNLDGGANLAVLKKNFVEQGLSREITPAAPASVVLQSIAVSIDNPRSSGVYADALDDSQTFTHPGAAALRVHFTQVATELDAACFDGACDNVYLYDAQGRLYQILNGTLAATDSVAIPGDSVRVRLVSDPSVGAFGYHVDRIDVLAPDLIFANGFQ